MNIWKALFFLVLVANTLNIPVQKHGDCDIEMMHVSFIPPSSMKITQLDNCGALSCWSQYVYSSDTQKVMGHSRVCSASSYGYRLYPVDDKNEEIKHEKKE